MMHLLAILLLCWQSPEPAQGPIIDGLRSLVVNVPQMRPLQELSEIAVAIASAAKWLAIAYVVGQVLAIAGKFVPGKP